MISDKEIALALENLSNTSEWMHIDHEPELGHPRVTVLTTNGILVSKSCVFLAQALKEVWEEVVSARKASDR